MKTIHSVYGKAAVAALAVLGFAGAAQARDNVYWSIGVESPGIAVGVTNARPVYVQPAPVYVYPQPVYVQPAPVYVQPRPVYVVPAPVYYGRPYGWHKKHGHHDRDDDDDDRRGSYRKGGYYVQAGPQPYVHGPYGFKPSGYYYDR